MYYSVNEHMVLVGPNQKEKRVVARLITQSEQIDFERLCTIMAKSATVKPADVAAVIFLLRDVLQEYCGYGFVVNAGPLGRFYPQLTTKVAKDLKSFNVAEHIKKASIRFVPAKSFRELSDVTYNRVTNAKEVKQGKQPNSTSGTSTLPPASGGVDSGL